MKCQNCGSENSENAKYCEMCGSKLEQPSVVDQEKTSETVQTAVNPQSTESEATSAVVQPRQVYDTPGYNVTEQNSGKNADGFAVASLILSLFGLPCSVTCINIFAILGLIFGILGVKSTKNKGVAIAGIIISSVGLLLTVVAVFCYFVALITNGLNPEGPTF